jgi:TolB-like protein
MGDFFAELRQRHIVRVAAAYAVVAWVLIQIVNNLIPMLHLPDWAGTLVLVLLGVGFPVALVFAWCLDLSRAESRPAKTPNARMDFILAGTMVLFIGLILYQQFAPATATRTAQTAVAPSPAAPTNGIALAVLPFANVSGDPGQEFFSDGMTDEIMTALAKVPSLRVVGRESAFSFKGKKADNRAVGQALGARYLIEGSVRKAGDRVRITAQLVQSDNGVSLWTESYDRELKDIFATQEDVARAVATALRAPLRLTEGGENLINGHTKNEAEYEDYLRAKALIRVRGGSAMIEGVAKLESVVDTEPDFAPAWALLAQAYLLNPGTRPEVFAGPIEPARRIVQSAIAQAEMAAQRAIRLDPRNSLAYAALARSRQLTGKWAESDELHKKALALDPGEPETLADYMNSLTATGYLHAAFEISRKLRELEPFVPAYAVLAASHMQMNGEVAASIPILESLPPDAGSGINRSSMLAVAYAEQGDYDKAADALLLITGNSLSRRSIEFAAKLLRTAPARVKDPASVPELEFGLSFVYGYVGADIRLLDSYRRATQMGYGVGANGSWSPAFKNLRKTQAYKNYLRSVGLVDYWRVKGWPDLCHPTTGDDFVCE